jgi:hypothetical protein
MPSRGTAAVDENGRAVLSFAADLKNLSRTAAIVEEVVEMHESGRWRQYETALGTQTWRECEFDYFLIACDVAYEDISKVLAWNRRGKDLAPAMVSDDARKRRSLETASQQWHAPSGESLADRAARRGWTNSRAALRRPPVPVRALAQARLGISMDEHARQQREAQISASRRRELKALVGTLADDLPELELRYVRDQLSAKLAGRGRPFLDPKQLARDVAELGEDTKALAKRWGVTADTARRRLASVRK